MLWTIDKIGGRSQVFIGSFGGFSGYGSNYSTATPQNVPSPAQTTAEYWARSAAMGGPAFANTSAADIAKLSIVPLPPVTPMSAMPTEVGGLYGTPKVKVDWAQVSKDPSSPYFSQALAANMEGLTPQTVAKYVNNTAKERSNQLTTAVTHLQQGDVPGYAYSGIKTSDSLNAAASYLLNNGYKPEQLLSAYNTIDQAQQYSNQQNVSGMSDLDNAINGEGGWLNKNMPGIIKGAVGTGMAVTGGIIAAPIMAGALGAGSVAAGAATGATAGAVGGATGAAVNNGNIGQIGTGALKGAATGALAGGATQMVPGVSNTLQGATGASPTTANIGANVLTGAGVGAGQAGIQGKNMLQGAEAGGIGGLVQGGLQEATRGLSGETGFSDKTNNALMQPISQAVGGAGQALIAGKPVDKAAVMGLIRGSIMGGSQILGQGNQFVTKGLNTAGNLALKNNTPNSLSTQHQATIPQMNKQSVMDMMKQQFAKK